MGNEKKNAPRPQHDWVKCNAAPLLMSNGLVASINRHHRIAIVDPPVQHKVESSVTSPSRGKNGSENIEFLGLFQKKMRLQCPGAFLAPPLQILWPKINFWEKPVGLPTKEAKEHCMALTTTSGYPPKYRIIKITIITEVGGHTNAGPLQLHGVRNECTLMGK